jgi:hypothetical protein
MMSHHGFAGINSGCSGVEDPCCFGRSFHRELRSRTPAQSDPTGPSSFRFQQFGVFRPGLVDDWQVGVGVLPEGEKLLVRSRSFGRGA